MAGGGNGFRGFAQERRSAVAVNAEPGGFGGGEIVTEESRAIVRAIPAVAWRVEAREFRRSSGSSAAARDAEWIATRELLWRVA